ncbi:hypothetical protein RN607_00545 [Demequina capsici]|uniref:Uncharacterized protein n=1 Tax=Demequina capsici TaxID=3075620 RepID=A0AA96FFB4_9MICO|nr:hypothetical protein [Demequina sp. PMTSA13]WNM27521.1 hypothetical protein RN607_00545 [Demequina sp. PMTSA13]
MKWRGDERPHHASRLSRAAIGGLFTAALAGFISGLLCASLMQVGG